MIYAIQATVNVHNPHTGYRLSTGVPTFFLDSEIQGIVDAAHAERIAKSMLSHGQPNIEVHAIATPSARLIAREAQ